MQYLFEQKNFSLQFQGSENIKLSSHIQATFLSFSLNISTAEKLNQYSFHSFWNKIKLTSTKLCIVEVLHDKPHRAYANVSISMESNAVVFLVAHFLQIRTHKKMGRNNV